MIERKDIYFAVIDSEEIGMLNIIFTPKKTFDKNKIISVIANFDKFKEIFDRLEIKKDKQHPLYKHDGCLGINQLVFMLLSEGFIYNAEVKEITENLFIKKYVPTSPNEFTG